MNRDLKEGGRGRWEGWRWGEVSRGSALQVAGTGKWGRKFRDCLLCLRLSIGALPCLYGEDEESAKEK